MIHILALIAAWLVMLAEPAFAVACGAEGQRPCKIWERIPSCNKGLVEDFSENRCVRKKKPKQIVCGGEKQRPCRVWERIPSCNKGLSENLLADRCRKPENLLIAARRTLHDSADVLQIGLDAAACLMRGDQGLLDLATRKRNERNAMELLKGTCLGRLMKTAKRKGYRTVTVGMAADAAKGFGVSGEHGVAYDTHFKKPLTFYHALGISGGAQAGAGISLAITLLKAQNNKISGDGHGFVMGAKALSGGGGGVWYNYDGEFEGITAAYGFGGGANAFAYNRTTTKISYIGRNTDYPGRTSTGGSVARKIWSAAGFSHDGYYAYAMGYDSPQSALKAMRGFCEGTCATTLTTEDRCLALVSDLGNSFWFDGAADDRATAERIAKEKCNKYIQYCKVHVADCRK